MIQDLCGHGVSVYVCLDYIFQCLKANLDSIYERVEQHYFVGGKLKMTNQLYLVYE